DMLDRRAGVELPARGIETFGMDGRTRPGRQRRLKITVPAKMMAGAMDGVVALHAHGCFSFVLGKPPPVWAASWKGPGGGRTPPPGSGLFVHVDRFVIDDAGRIDVDLVRAAHAFGF